MSSFFHGITHYFTGVQLIAYHRLWLYFWIPVLLSFVIGAAVLSLAWGISDNLGGWLVALYPFEWGRVVVEKIATIMSGVSLVVFTLLLFRYIIMAIASPFMSLLSERLEQKINPDRPTVPFSIARMLRELFRGIRIALRNIVRELLLTLLLLLLSVLLPFMAPVTSVLILLLQAYYAGFGNFDFTLERSMNVRQSVQYVRGNRMLVLGNGIVFVLLLMTVVGFLFALPLGTAAGTVSVLEQRGRQPLS